jgi:DNA-binding NarL/FixJ family response regulator
MESPPRITVLLADDHSLVRRGFRRILEDDPGIAVVGEAQDGDEVIQLARRHKPQVIVMDCAMPGTNGVAATRQILQESPDVAVLMLSMHAEDTLVRQAMAAGARGYILKQGETVIDPSVSPATALKGERNRALSERELDVLRLICEGLSNREIATRLSLSVNTVAVHRANIMNALGVHKTAELVVYAIQHGLVNLP